MTRPIIEIEDGEWVTIAWKRQREKCCDCGLEHDVDYRVEDGNLQFPRAPAKSAKVKA
jgi:hypothetical protein